MSAQRRPHQLDPDAYRSLVEGVPAILYIDEVDDPSSSRYTSPQVSEMLGFTPDEWSNDPELWTRLLHPEDRDRAIAEHRRSNESFTRFLSEYRLVARDGRVVWIRDEAIPVRDEDGTPLYWRGVMLDITEQKHAEDQLRWSLDVLRRTIQQRRELAQRLENAQEEERRRIAADIHDDSIQVMSAVDMRLQILTQLGNEPPPLREIQQIQQIVQQAIDRLRSLLFELRPVALDRDGLVEALRLYLAHAAHEAGWTWEISGTLEREPPPDLRAVLYRIAQQAMANARKHAGASRVEVAVAGGAAGYSVTVRDDGKGFDAAVIGAPEPGHLGLPTMLERAELSGGYCRVTTSPGAGATVEIWLPADVDAEQPGASRPA